ncbi:acetyl-CoA hydrolase/transferase C-terminal domain-containing protein [Propylenella binzhouense]|uniref:acetyl-CoA hydrolase/transferase C-terminal domain-containing protein n=1 Tax=Propylenella binzhouense TaxID=2555902 RepID=UPI001966EB57
MTEHGIADLRTPTLAQRPEALIAIADPAFRDDLHERGHSGAWSGARNGTAAAHSQEPSAKRARAALNFWARSPAWVRNLKRAKLRSVWASLPGGLAFLTAAVRMLFPP